MNVSAGGRILHKLSVPEAETGYPQGKIVTKVADMGRSGLKCKRMEGDTQPQPLIFTLPHVGTYV